MKHDLTLDDAVNKCKYSEMVKSQNNVVRKVDAIKDSNRRNYNSRGRGGSRNHQGRGQGQSANFDVNKDKTCGRCGYVEQRAHKNGQCPAKNDTCRFCNKMGHYEKCCFKKKQLNSVENFYQDEEDQDSALSGIELNIGSLENKSKEEPPWLVRLKVNDNYQSFKIDSGADVTVMSVENYAKMRPKPYLKTNKVRLQGVSGNVKHVGYFEAEIRHKDKNYKETIYVVNHKTQNLLGRGISCEMNLIKRLNAIGEVQVYGDLGLMQCQPVKIQLKDDCVPYSISTPRRIPLPLVPKVKEEIDKMLKVGVIVEEEGPTDWCSPIVPVTKPNGRIRICVDLKKLNQAVKRERFVIPTVEDILGRMSGSVMFSHLDASSGYWQMPLDEQSSRLTTFITPFGRYRFTRVPFGITSASEIYQREMNRILNGIQGVEVYQDDVMIHSKDEKDHDEILKRVLKRIEESGLKLNKSKCKFKQKSITFLGHIIDKEGLSAHPDKVKAILEMPPPNNVSELRSFMGMTNFMSRFVKDLSQKMEPISRLLKSDMQWVWDGPQQKAFQDVKVAISESAILAYYDPTRPTLVSSDASSYGMGGVIMQEDDDGNRRPVAFVSRTMTECEKRYAQIEKELLGVVWACERFSRYLIGLDKFRIITDHKPLVPIINKKDLDVVPIRCQRLLIRLMRYNGVAEHVPGKSLVLADLLSRKPIQCPLSQDEDLEMEVECCIQTIVTNLPASKNKLTEIVQASERDPIINKVQEMTINGWPESHKINPDLKELYNVRSLLSVSDGLLLYRDRLVIPKEMRKDMLEKIHNGHPGVTKSRLKAQEAIWWPNISKDIEEYVKDCHHCQINQSSQRAEPLISGKLPERPWQNISADLMDHNHHSYLVVTDNFSKWIEIIQMRSTASYMLIKEMKNLFARWGVPELLRTDNGTQFVSNEFRKFVKDFNMTIETSSPHYPQANGSAEQAVKQAKKILDQEDQIVALMAYRATPNTITGYSPCQLLQGRRMATDLPMLKEKLLPGWPTYEKVNEKFKSAKVNQKYYFDKRNGARPLSPLRPGDPVRVKIDNDKKWSSPAEITESLEGGRSYVVDTGNGVYRRNRRHLLATPPCDVPVHTDIPVHADQPTDQPTDQPSHEAQQQSPDPARPIRVTRGKRPERYKDFQM